MAHRSRSGAEQHVAAGLALQHEREVLRAHGGTDVAIDLGRTDQPLRHRRRDLDLLGGVDRRRVAAHVAEVGGGAVRLADAVHHGLHRALEQVLDLGHERARAAADGDLLGDHVPGVAAVDLGGGDHGVIERVEAARHHALERGDDLRRDRQRIDADVRQRGVGAAAAHHDLELVVGREDGAHPHGEGALGQAREVVQAVDALDREALEQAVGDHHLAAALVLLGGLEDEADDAVEVAGGGQVAGGAEEHRGVAVVAAGVHGAVARRAVRAGRCAPGSAARPCRRAARSRARSCRERSVPTTPVLARPRWTSMPNDSRRSATSAEVRTSSKATSGWRWKSWRQATSSSCIEA